MSIPKAGPLTREDLLAVWRGAVDKTYGDDLLRAGEGNGLEVVTQLCEQLARASLAVDRVTQSMFVRPWSGQTSEPAGGEARATVTLTFRRTRRLEQPLVLGAGQVFVEEQTTDWGDPAGVTVRTGRRYTPVADLVFHPGEAGPLEAECVAERPGWGYNNPLPGTIRSFAQAGANFFHDRATVTVGAAVAPPAVPPPRYDVEVATVNEADTFVPEHLGQYVLFTAGANAGKVGRVVQFLPPDLSVPRGSQVEVELAQSFASTAFAGAFEPGEVIAFDSGGPAVGHGRLLGARVDGAGTLRATFVLLSGAMGTAATGLLSGATAAVDFVLSDQTFAAEAPIGGVGGASWRVLGWESDWGLSAENELSPEGGRCAMLDELGNERAIYRAPGESDESYRQRVAEVADVVSPNAIRRAARRALGNVPFCFREVGSAGLPGFFYDGDGGPPGSHATLAAAAKADAYDTDVIVVTGTSPTPGPYDFQEPAVFERAADGILGATGYVGRVDAGVTLTFIRTSGTNPASPVGWRVRGLKTGKVFDATASTVPATVSERRYRYYLDYVEFRAFFLITVPHLSAGEFGFAYDDHPEGAYDAAPHADFYDGFPAQAALLMQSLWQAVDVVRAGGVSWQLEQDDGPCP